MNRDRARVHLGELAARLDDQLTLVLAFHYGRDVDHVLSMVNSVLWHVGVDQRIGLLDDALWRTGLHDDVPFLVPSLRAVFHTRNLLAHSIGYAESPEALTLLSVRRGKRKLVTVTAGELGWAVKTAMVCVEGYLPRIEGRIGDVATWGRLYGFDER